jgi:hypothetical protein
MARNRGLVSCLLGILVLLVSTLLGYRLPDPRAAADERLPAFSAYRAQAELEALVGDGVAHPIGSDANARVRERIVQRLSALGYETQIQSGFVCNTYAVCGTPSNIIARLPSRQSSDAADDADLVLLAAHYDSVPAGPGASDDAAGVAVALEIARILTVMPPTRHPVAILITDGEEAGLLGAVLFVRHEPMAKQVAAAVNVEARGSSGPSLMFETGSANAWLMSLYQDAVARPITDSVYYDAYQTLPNSTDFTVFKSVDWQGFNFAFIGDVGHYHTALDTVANADLRSIQHQGDNALENLLALADSRTLRSLPPSDAVYFDVLSRVLVAWPARYSLVASSIILGLLLIEAVFLYRSGRVRGRQIAWGGLGVVTCLVLGGISSGGMLMLLVATAKVPPLDRHSWIAHPVWMNMACAALAACAAAISGHWFRLRAGFWGFWLGAVLLLAMLSELEAALRPGLGFISLITAAVAVIAVIPSLISDAGTPVRGAGRSKLAIDTSWAIDFAALAPVWATFALIIPLISLLYAAIGSVAWVIDTLELSLGATLSLPLIAAASSPLRRWIIAVTAVASIIGLLVTLALPTYSATWPQRVNFRYSLDANRHEAVWMCEPDSLKLPADVAKSAAFGTELEPEPSGGRARAFRAPAPSRDLPPPLLGLRAVTAGRFGTTRYDVHLQSQRGAPDISVSFPGASQIKEVIVSEASGEKRIALPEAQHDMTRLHLVGVPPQGIDFSVEVRGASLEAHLVDQSYGLPEGESLRRLRPPEATSSQDGDTTLVQNTVTLDPAAGSPTMGTRQVD